MVLVYTGCGELVFKNGINKFGQGDKMVCGSFWAGRYHYCKKCQPKADVNVSGGDE